MVRFPSFLAIEPDHPGDRRWEDMAYGVFPPGMHANGSALVCRGDRIPLSSSGVLLKSWTLSRVAPRPSGVEPTGGWSRIRKKNLKDLYLELFVVQQMTQHALTTGQGRELLAYIMTALHFKLLDPAVIAFNGSYITAIDGITFTPGGYECRVPLTGGVDKCVG